MKLIKRLFPLIVYHLVHFIWMTFILIGIIIPTQASNRILNYDVSAVLDSNASLLVTENITVHIKHDTPKQGITRTYSIRKAIDQKWIQKMTLDIQSITLDGKPVPYLLQEGYYMDELTIGNDKTPLSEGNHTYIIRYRTQGHVRYFDNHDEIQLNLINADNDFPIDKTSFSIVLPNGQKPLTATAITNTHSQKIHPPIKNNPLFETTETLPTQTNMLLSVTFPKGLVNEAPTSFSGWLNHHRTLVLLGLPASLCLYLMGCWYFIYRKPQKNITPISSPPENVTPGLVAWMKNRMFTPTMLQADLIWIAIHGFAKIDISDFHNIRCIQIPALTTNTHWVTRACRSFYKRFYDTDNVILFGKDGSHPARSMTHAWDIVYRWYRNLVPSLIQKSYLPGIIGIGIWGLAFYCLLDFIYHPGFIHGMGAADTILLPGFFLGFSAWMIAIAIHRRINTTYRHFWYSIAKPFCHLMLAILAFLSAAYLLDFDWLFLTAFFIIGLLPILFFRHFLIQFTPQGERIADAIKALEMYITMPEAKRYTTDSSLETIEKYEELLPYAIAIGKAEIWQKRFESLLKKTNYHPTWIIQSDSTKTHHDNYDTILHDFIANSSVTHAIRAAMAESETIRNKLARGEIDANNVKARRIRGGW